MAHKYVFLEDAIEELAEISGYLSATLKSEQAALRFLDSLQQKIDPACSNPELFALSRLPQLAEKGYRAALVNNYVMLYTFSDDTIYIAHIFHQRQDYASLV